MEMSGQVYERLPVKVITELLSVTDANSILEERLFCC